MTTVTFMPGVTPPDELSARREAERERRESTRCANPKCRQLRPNHLLGCEAARFAIGDGPDGGEAA